MCIKKKIIDVYNEKPGNSLRGTLPPSQHLQVKLGQ